MSDTSFLEDAAEGMQSGDLEKLGAMLTLLANKEERVAELTNELKQLEKEVRGLSREEIPDFLLSRGLRDLTLEDGTRVEVKEKVSVRLPKDPVKKNIVLKWLIEQGGGNLIDQKLTVDDPEQDIIDYCKKQGIPFNQDRNVHFARFKSFVSSKLGLTKGSLPEIEASDIPKEANLYVYKETKLKKK